MRTEAVARAAQASQDGEPLSMAHRGEIETLLLMRRQSRSEYCFANLFLFRAVHDYRFVRGPHPFILGRTYDGVRHALPLGPLTPAGAALMLDHADCLFPLSEADSDALPGAPVQWLEADSDYLYDAGRMAVLEGAVVKAKRTQARTFARTAEPSAVWLDAETTPLAAILLDRWLEDTGRAAADTDVAICRNALTHWQALDLEGFLILSCGEPQAFLLASTLADGSKAVHFAKGRWRPPGVYPYLFSRYAAVCGVSVLNFEQDLGLPGFRQAKQSLDPVARLRKLRIYRNGDAGPLE